MINHVIETRYNYEYKFITRRKKVRKRVGLKNIFTHISYYYT